MTANIDLSFGELPCGSMAECGASPSRQRMDSLVCGLPRRRRSRRLSVMLNAFMDESANEDRQGAHVVAGYVGFAPQWKDFSDEWDKVLHTTPEISYYKRNDLNSDDECKRHGLSVHQARTKTRHLANVIENSPNILFSVVADVSQKAFYEVTKGIPRLPKKLKQPYQFCFHCFVAETLWHIVDLGIPGDCVDFVMDRNGKVTDDAATIFGGIRKVAPSPVREMMGDAIPQDGRYVAPLQAADMLAGCVKDYVTHRSDRSLKTALLKISGKGERSVTVHITKDRLASFYASPSIRAVVSR